MQGTEGSRGARIGNAVRRLRRSRQPPLTQRELAELASVAPGTIAFLETGRVRNPSPAVTDALASALGFPDTAAMLRAGREILTSGGVPEASPDEAEESAAESSLESLTSDVAALKGAVQSLQQGQGELWQAYFQHVAARRGAGRAAASAVPHEPGMSTADTSVPRLRIEDDTMEPWLSPGDFALYDPGARPRSGDPVVAGVPAEDTGTERVLVRYYFPRRRRVELRALRGEPIFRPTETVIVYGVVRERLQPVPRWEEASGTGGPEEARAHARKGG
jgi:transcriptional regulator with XRE-family HTH domain